MKKAISDILWELIPHQNKYVLTEKDILDYITNLQNNWYDLKTYCKLERHESNNMKEGEIYNEIITKMEQLERGD